METPQTIQSALPLTPSAGAEERSITIAQSANFSMGFAPGVQSYEATYYMNNFYEAWSNTGTANTCLLGNGLGVLG